MKPALPIHIAASGDGSRMSEHMAELGFPGMPKHLLRTGNGEETLVGRNVQLAQAFSDDVRVHVNERTRELTETALSLPTNAIITDPAIRPLGPLTFMQSVPAGETAGGVGSDVYLQHSPWSDVVRSHALGKLPLTFLVGRVDAPAGSLLFDTDQDGTIERLRRISQPERGFRNIGVYVFTFTPPVVELVEAYASLPDPHMEDTFARELIAHGLAGAAIYRSSFFNINNVANYLELRQFTGSA